MARKRCQMGIFNFFLLSPSAQNVQVENLSWIDSLRLNEDADLLAHTLAVQQGHGAVASGEVCALQLLEKAAGGEPESLAGEGHSSEAGRLAGADQSGE